MLAVIKDIEGRTVMATAIARDEKDLEENGERFALRRRLSRM